MILHGFTPNQEKELLLDLIKSSRSLMRTFSELIITGSSMAEDYYKFIAHEQALIKKNIAKLVALERFRIKEGLEPDEKYRLPGWSASGFRR